MTSLSIADVPWISKRIKACCRRAKLFSTHEILLNQPQQLQQALRISQADVDLLLLQVATASAPAPISVLDALNGELSAPNLDANLFGAATAAAADDNDNDVDSADGTDSSDADDEQVDDARFPPSSIVPPTQGYDGNFPGADRFVYDSDDDSDSDDAENDADVMMHDDVEPPSTFRRPQTQHAHRIPPYQDEHEYDLENDTDRPSVARDVLSLGRERHVFSSGSQELDDLLGGGFRSALLTELVGESGSGKTQMAIQACTFAALGFVPLPSVREHDIASSTVPIRDATQDDTLRDILQSYGMEDSSAAQNGLAACYIASGGERAAHSIINRALELASFAIVERFNRLYSLPSADTQSAQDADLDRHVLLARAQQLGREQVLANLHVACVADVEALEHALKYSLPGLMSRLASAHKTQAGPSPQVGIIVVDNLPSLFQEDAVAASDIDSLVQRSKMLVEIADALKRLAVASRHPSELAVRRSSPSAGRAVLVLNHVSDAFGIDKEIARRFVFDSADRIRLNRSQTRRVGVESSSPQQHQPLSDGGSKSALPDHPLAMDIAAQSAFVSGLLASVPPTLAEAIGARAFDETRGSNDGPLYTLHPRTAQLGHTWSNLINVRLFLSKTRGRVCMPTEEAAAAAAAAAQTVAEGAGKKSVMTTVRKAAVVINPFGPTMLDSDGGDGLKRATRQLRFVITPGRAVYVLNPYSSASLNGVTPLTTTSQWTISNNSTALDVSQPQQNGQADDRGTEEPDEEDLFGEALEEHHWLAIDRFQSQVMEGLTPSS